MDQRSARRIMQGGVSGLIGLLLVTACLPGPTRVSPAAIGKEGTLKTSFLPGAVGAAGRGGSAASAVGVASQPLAAPIISNNGANVLKGSVRVPASIISHNGGNIVSNNGGTIISHNGGNIISHNGGNIISNNGGNVRISQVPLAFTTVRLKDAAGAPVKDAQGQALVTKTDANGNYAFPVDVKGRNLVIEAEVEGQAGKLKSLLPKDGLQAGKGLDVDLASTLTLAYILEQYVKGDLATFERLPKDIEAKARVVTEEAIVEKQIELPKTLETEVIVAKVNEVRRAAPKVDTIFDEIKVLLLLVGVRNDGDGLPATSLQTGLIGGLAADEAGNTFVFSPGYHALWKVTPDGIAHTLVGRGKWGYQEQDTGFLTPGYNSGVVVGPEGDVYVADTYNHRIVKVSTSRAVEVIAGTGFAGFGGDGGAATTALLNRPSGLVRDSAGNLYVSDTENHRVRCIDKNGRIRTIAGDGNQGATGDGALAVDARLSRPQGLALGLENELYVADNGNDKVRVLQDGRITTLATTETRISSPMAVAFDSDGGLIVVCHYSSRVVRIKQEEVTDFIDFSTNLDGVPGFRFSFPRAIGVSSRGVMVDTGQEVAVRMIDRGNLSSAIGSLLRSTDQPTSFHYANSIVVDKAERIFVADMNAKKLFEVAVDGSVVAIAGNGQDPDKLISQSPLETGVGMVAGLAISNDGGLLFSNFGLFPTVKRLDLVKKEFSALVGNGNVEYRVPPVGLALNLALGMPSEVVRLNDGRIVFSDGSLSGIFLLTSDGQVEYLVSPSQIGRAACFALSSSGDLAFVDRDAGELMLYVSTVGFTARYYTQTDIGSAMPMADIRSISFDEQDRLYVASARRVIRLESGEKPKLIVGQGAQLLNGTSRDDGVEAIRDIFVSPAGHLYLLEEEGLKRIPKEQLEEI